MLNEPQTSHELCLSFRLSTPFSNGIQSLGRHRNTHQTATHSDRKGSLFFGVNLSLLLDLVHEVSGLEGNHVQHVNRHPPTLASEEKCGLQTQWIIALVDSCFGNVEPKHIRCHKRHQRRWVGMAFVPGCSPAPLQRKCPATLPAASSLYS
jgi:hypothetical protein